MEESRSNREGQCIDNQSAPEQQYAPIVITQCADRSEPSTPPWVAQLAVGGLVLVALFFGFIMGWLAH